MQGKFGRRKSGGMYWYNVRETSFLHRRMLSRTIPIAKLIGRKMEKKNINGEFSRLKIFSLSVPVRMTWSLDINMSQKMLYINM